MKNLNSKTSKRKQRTCWDRLRTRMLQARRRRRTDPAATAAAQIKALFAIIVGRMPLVPAVPGPMPYVAPALSTGQARRIETARRLGIPSRYVDVVIAQGTVPYALLFEHIRRGGRSREDAMVILRQKAPASCREWLDHIEAWGLWSSLLLCHVDNGVDEDTDVKLLTSTLAWVQDPDRSNGVRGPAEAETVLKPGTGVGGPDPDDPKIPKP
ncbi:hypothetical protein GOB36_11630 [Sinorhizobium meliloti]|uniref:hypothetical protein n=1 Tax=Rhizobium meliloti TaxID=382 RepID=UPI00299D8350|nr:hypothetical protein [Sinorhizobium meliloti]MDX0032276.1 hypothetical protein [Sinorhizobium meliloti]